MRYDTYKDDWTKDTEKEEPIKEPTYAKLMRVTSKYFKSINVRQDPSPSGKVIAVVKVGTEVFGSDSARNGFTGIQLENGQEGYIMSKFLEII